MSSVLEQAPNRVSFDQVEVRERTSESFACYVTAKDEESRFFRYSKYLKPESTWKNY